MSHANTSIMDSSRGKLATVPESASSGSNPDNLFHQRPASRNQGRHTNENSDLKKARKIATVPETVVTSPPNDVAGVYMAQDASGGKRKDLGKFLGVGDESSTWLKWSQERRASFKKRLDVIEQNQRELEKTRVSTPIRKARKESVMFVSKELKKDHVISDQLEEQQAKLNRQINLNARQTRASEIDVRLSVNQWNILIKFWQHSLFERMRKVAMLFDVIAMILTAVSIVVNQWMFVIADPKLPFLQDLKVSLWHECPLDGSGNNCTQLKIITTGYSIGLWTTCSFNLTRTQTAETSTPASCYNDYQNGIIGMLIFAVAFSVLGLVLSVCGVCSATLSKKLYYFHSAGEIFLVCAFATCGSLILYPTSISMTGQYISYKLGVGYGLCVGATFFYLAAALCMSLDCIVHSLASSVCCSKS